MERSDAAVRTPAEIKRSHRRIANANVFEMLCTGKFDAASYLKPQTTTHMRFKGKLSSWNDERGFGFIDPIQGGEEIFVHIKAFAPRRSRPQVNELLWFEVEIGPQGKTRAKNVELVQVSARDEVRGKPATKPVSVTLVTIPGFVLLYVVVGILWQPPVALVAIYVGASVVTYLAYAKDKFAAHRGAWRTPESTLHLLAFAGGWPGALLAQQFLRHKSSKAEFRLVFWSTVILNVVSFVLFCSPLGQQMWDAQK